MLSNTISNVMTFTTAGLLLGSFGCDDGSVTPVSATIAALSADQCEWFDNDTTEKIRICHKTSSATNPYVILQVSTSACIQGHADHVGDYVTSTNPLDATYDPSCNGLGCLPEGAPADKFIECCKGLSVDSSGHCAAPRYLCDYPETAKRLPDYQAFLSKDFIQNIFAAYQKKDCGSVGKYEEAAMLLSQLRMEAVALQSVADHEFSNCSLEASQVGMLPDEQQYKAYTAYLQSQLDTIKATEAWLATVCEVSFPQ